LSALEDLHLHSIDISHAFINGDLDEEVYMQQPEGFALGSPDQVLRLRKSIYGLKQVSRMWYQKLQSVLVEMGFECVRVDSSIYVYSKGTTRIILPVFVDDITLASNSLEAIESVIKELSSHFRLRDLGPTSFLLGIQITRDRPNHSISLCQHQYILDLLERFSMSDCKPVLTPMLPGLRLSSSMCPQSPQEVVAMKDTPYVSAVGALLYLATATRPDIAHTVSLLCRFNNNPGMEHWKAVKHLFRYLKGTVDLQLTYSPSPSRSGEPFVTYTDSDHGGDPDTSRSTSGYLLCIGTGAVSWSSKLQSLVALSTTEAEFIAAVEAGKEIMWMRNLLQELGFPVSQPSTFHIDNQSALSVAKNPEHHGRMKHLDMRYFWLRDAVEQGILTPAYVPTEDQAADLLTKSLCVQKVVKCCGMMGLR
jgi:Reverse transcriptase (RNA-dependent DNA polymerase)